MNRPVLSLLFAIAAVPAAAQTTILYRCPGNVYTSSGEISAKQAEERGCKQLADQPVTVVQSQRPQGGSAAPAARAGAPVPPRSESKVDPGAQRERDTDARRILESELRREEEKLAGLQKDFNNGEPERRGDERNAQKYIDRVAEMKAAIARKEADLAAIRRELAKLPPT